MTLAAAADRAFGSLVSQLLFYGRDDGCFEVIRTLWLAPLIALGAVSSAMAAATVPEEYQGVWAEARDCKQNFQNILAHVVNREYATCRVMQVSISDHPGGHTATISLNCAGSRSREIWHDESIDGTDFLVSMQFKRKSQAGGPIAIYKRCPLIPISEIPLSDIPGNDTRR
jgi:hypothetical protein